MTYAEATALAKRANALMKHQDEPDGFIWARVAIPNDDRPNWEVHVVFTPKTD